jgi:hypothetical protein
MNYLVAKRIVRFAIASIALTMRLLGLRSAHPPDYDVRDRNRGQCNGTRLHHFEQKFRVGELHQRGRQHRP